MRQRTVLRRLIKAYMKQNKLNTYLCRKIVKSGRQSPMGIGINTVNKILLDNSYHPTPLVVKTLLKKMGVKYTLDCGQVQICTP